MEFMLLFKCLSLRAFRVDITTVLYSLNEASSLQRHILVTSAIIIFYSFTVNTFIKYYVYVDVRAECGMQQNYNLLCHFVTLCWDENFCHACVTCTGLQPFGSKQGSHKFAGLWKAEKKFKLVNLNDFIIIFLSSF